MSDTQAETVEVMGRELNCLVCGHNEFHKREAQLNTAVASFFDFDWANASGTCVICDNCGYIHWFYPTG
jgi:predicted nucleic-acid-binding Zn-ribbon protein